MRPVFEDVFAVEFEAHENLRCVPRFRGESFADFMLTHI